MDDFIGVGLPTTARKSFDCFYDLLQELGFTISAKKLVETNTQAVCLGVLIDSAISTFLVPEEKLHQIKTMVKTWANRK